jgi:anti-anti-sigma factor
VKIRRKEVGGVDVLSFEGEFDASTLPAVAAIDQLIGEGRIRLVFSLAGLTFVASPVLGYFVKTSKRLKEAGGALVFSRPSHFMQAAIRTLGLDQMFEIFPDDAAAAQHLEGVRGPPKPGRDPQGPSV